MRAGLDLQAHLAVAGDGVLVDGARAVHEVERDGHRVRELVVAHQAIGAAVDAVGGGLKRVELDHGLARVHLHTAVAALEGVVGNLGGTGEDQHALHEVRGTRLDQEAGDA